MSGKPRLKDKRGQGWIADEAATFYDGYMRFGRNWDKIAELIGTKNPVQVDRFYRAYKDVLSNPEISGHFFIANVVGEADEAGAAAKKRVREESESNIASKRWKEEYGEDGRESDTEDEMVMAGSEDGEDGEEEEGQEQGGVGMHVSGPMRSRLEEKYYVQQTPIYQAPHLRGDTGPGERSEYVARQGSMEMVTGHTGSGIDLSVANYHAARLRVTQLRRHEWAFVRRKLGRPRRLSRAFLHDDAENLEAQRQRIRKLQQGQPLDPFSVPVQLPAEIPMVMVVGDRVLAKYMVRVCEGTGSNISGMMYPGCILAVDSVNSTYRVQFDRPELGIHTLADVDVMPVLPAQCMPVDFKKQRLAPKPPPVFLRPINSYQPLLPAPQPYREIIPVPMTPSGSLSTRGAIQNLLTVTSSGISQSEEQQTEMLLAGFPVSVMESGWVFHEIQFLARMYKIMRIRKVLVEHLKDMNDKAERIVALRGSGGLELEFRRQYAWTVVQLQRLDAMMKPAMGVLSAISNKEGDMDPISIDGGDARGEGGQESSMQVVERIRNNAADVAESMAVTLLPRLGGARPKGTRGGDTPAEGHALRTAVTDCLSLLLHIQTCSQEDLPPVEVASVLEAAMARLKPRFNSNMGLFREIEHCIAVIKSGITAGGMHSMHD